MAEPSDLHDTVCKAPRLLLADGPQDEASQEKNRADGEIARGIVEFKRRRHAMQLADARPSSLNRRFVVIQACVASGFVGERRMPFPTDDVLFGLCDGRRESVRRADLRQSDFGQHVIMYDQNVIDRKACQPHLSLHQSPDQPAMFLEYASFRSK